MASVKVILDTRRKKYNGTFPLKMRVTHNRTSRDISLNISIKKSEWNAPSESIKSSHPNSKRYNYKILKAKTDANNILLQSESRLSDLTIEEVRELIARNDVEAASNCNPQNPKYNQYTLLEYNQIIIDRFRKAGKFGTAKSYFHDINAVKRYLGGGDILLKEIDYNFLLDFEADCYGRGISRNGVHHYLRTLRSLINKAIEAEDLDEKFYPFKKFKLKRDATPKRAVSKECFEMIRKLKLEKGTDLWHFRNYMLFMFNMQGMNFIDMVFLTKEKNIKEDRVEYFRRKTGKFYSIGITKEARDILDYYLEQIASPTDYLFPLIPREVWGDKEQELKKYEWANKRCNEHFKVLCLLAGLKEKITTYVIRHSWATIANQMKVSKTVIQGALGHEKEETTNIYLAPHEHKVLDEANRLVVS